MAGSKAKPSKGRGSSRKGQKKERGKVCGAKTRAGTPCQRRPMANGRCSLHGGKSTGAPIGNQNARKHGLYAKYMTEAELALADQMTVGSVDSELAVLRVKLAAALQAQAEFNAQQLADDAQAAAATRAPPGMETESRTLVVTNRQGGVQTVHRRRDYSDEILRLTMAIGRLELVRAKLAQTTSDPSELAREIGGFLEAIRDGFMQDEPDVEKLAEQHSEATADESRRALPQPETEIRPRDIGFTTE